MEVSVGRSCCRFLGLQFHYSKLWFFHRNWKAFTYTPWLPYDWRFQAIYLAYRWIIALYFLGWIIATGVYSSSGPTYFIYLTNWGFITFNGYLIIAAVSTTVSYLSTHFICKQTKDEFSRRDEFLVQKPLGCCGYQDNKISWYQMIHWIFFTLGNEVAFMVLVLYWSLLYRGGFVDGFNANTHLVNGLVAVVDLWVSGVPINFLHIPYPMLYGGIYSIFTGIYFAAANKSVYSVIDYKEGIGLAIAIVVVTVFIILPIVHSFFFFMYLGKVGILYCIFGKKLQSREDEATVVDSDEKKASLVV